MTTDDETKNALVALGVGPAAQELYKDLLRPSALVLGKDLEVVARLVSHALSPLEAVVWGLDRVRDWLRAALLKRLASVDPDDIELPPPYIAGQILLQLPFCADQEELREMYANLLAAAMKKDTAHEVHPSFVHVIQQLTPAEAVLLRHVQRTEQALYLEEAGIIGGKGKGKSISEQFKALCEEAGIDSLESSDCYLDNLVRLRLLSVLDGDESRYLPPGDCEYGTYDASVENEWYRIVEVSSYGERFLKTCVTNVEPIPSPSETTP